MNFALDDRQRSVRRYVAMGMDGLEAYDLQLQRVQIRDDQRPAGLVEPATTAVAVGRPSHAISGGPVPTAIHEQQTFSIILYPRIEGADVRDVSLRVRQHAQRLEDVFGVGLVNDDGSDFSPPERVPVWDYALATATGSGRSVVPAEPYGWLVVEERSVRPLQDPLDERRWSIVCSLRCSWWRAGRDDTGPVVTSMPGRWAGEPPGEEQIAIDGGVASEERWGTPTVTRTP
jgi:hypothetical protein